MTESEVVLLLREEVQRAGTQRDYAHQNNISLPYLSDVLRGRRKPSKLILDVLGMERVETYQKKQEKQ